MNRTKSLLITMVLLFSVGPALAQDSEWPRTVLIDEGMVTIYAPQIEALDGETLYYRAALAYRANTDAEPIFGAGWFKSPVEIDEDAGVVSPAHLDLTQTRFPDGTADIQAELASAMARQSSGWNLDFSVAELESALEAAEAESLAAQKIKTAPPKIIYRDNPALLVTIDGDPVLREVEDSPYQAVINTPYPLISDGKNYYLNAAKGAWYRADAATGPYRFDTSPPAAIVQMVEAAADTEDASESTEDTTMEPITAANAPEIVVTTEQAELIVTEGPADFVPLVGDLLVLQNSDDDVFMDVDTQNYYIVLAGRWYTAPSLNGPWAYQAADALPADFARIPDDSAQSDSRVYVAGTDEAEEAVLDAYVPQTAKVERGEVEIDVDYDGEPEFEPVEGTETLHYARNTGATVLNSDRVYYLLEDGVWYVSSSAHGPWVVSDHRPGELETIAPSSPVYNTKYVYVYDATPEVVYVGYTPGYLGSYVYSNTIVYGTGWHYRPYVSPRYYYPRHRTWGYHVGYNNWSGWSFGLSWYWGPLSLSYYTGGYWHYHQPWYNRYWGYWGPHGYRYRPHYYGGYRHHRYAYNDHGRGHRKGYRHYDRWNDDYRRHDRYDRGHDRYGRERHRNLYRDDRQRARVADTRDSWASDRDRRDDRARVVDNRKVHQSATGPVRSADLRAKAQVREVNRAASRERMVADKGGEVRRASPGQDKIRQSRTEPVSRSELRARAVQPDKRARNRTEPVSRSELRARAVQAEKRTQSRTEPISRSDLRARAAQAAKRGQSHTEPVTRDEQRRPDVRSIAKPERRSANADARQSRAREMDKRDNRSTRQIIAPAREVDSRRVESRSSRQVATPSRQVRQREARTQPSRQVATPSRQVKPREARTQPSRQIAAPSRQVKPREARTQPSRQIAAPSRQVKPREARTQPSRPVSPPSRAERRVTPPTRQISREPSRSQVRAPQRSEPQRSAPQRSAPQRSAPQQRAPQRSAPQRSAPQRSAPQRSAPQRSAPRQKAERNSPQRERGESRDRRRN